MQEDLETADAEPVPSAGARARLRAAVVKELRVPTLRPWRWWERPLAEGPAIAAVIIAVTTTQAISVGPGAAPRTLSRRT